MQEAAEIIVPNSRYRCSANLHTRPLTRVLSWQPWPDHQREGLLGFVLCPYRLTILLLWSIPGRFRRHWHGWTPESHSPSLRPENRYLHICIARQGGNIIVLLYEKFGIIASISQVCYNALCDFTVEFEFKKASVGTAFARCALTVAIVNKNFHRQAGFWVSCSAHRFRTQI